MVFELSDYEAEVLARYRKEKRRDRLGVCALVLFGFIVFALVQIAEGIW